MIDKLLAPTVVVALLSACASPPAPAPSPAPGTARTAPGAPARGAPDAAPRGSNSVSMATTPKAYRVDGARYLYSVYAGRIFKGKLPPLIHAIVVTEVELDAGGNVRKVEMVRVPSHAPEVVVKVREMIMAASPLPAPQRMGGTRYTEIWLVDKSGRFQLDTLTEGQL